MNIFEDKTSDSKQQNAADLISDLVKTGRELLIHNNRDNVGGILAKLEKVEITRALLNNIFKSQTKHSIISGLKIIQDLLVYRVQMYYFQFVSIIF